MTTRMHVAFLLGRYCYSAVSQLGSCVIPQMQIQHLYSLRCNISYPTWTKSSPGLGCVHHVTIRLKAEITQSLEGAKTKVSFTAVHSVAVNIHKYWQRWTGEGGSRRTTVGQFDQYQRVLSKTVGELRLLRHGRTGRFKRRSLKDL